MYRVSFRLGNSGTRISPDKRTCVCERVRRLLLTMTTTPACRRQGNLNARPGHLEYPNSGSPSINAARRRYCWLRATLGASSSPTYFGPSISFAIIAAGQSGISELNPIDSSRRVPAGSLIQLRGMLDDGTISSNSDFARSTGKV
jgi:hypothetical protein